MIHIDGAVLAPPAAPAERQAIARMMQAYPASKHVTPVAIFLPSGRDPFQKLYPRPRVADMHDFMLCREHAGRRRPGDVHEAHDHKGAIAKDPWL
jgi:hypothetical protein